MIRTNQYMFLTGTRKGFLGNDGYTKLLIHCDGDDESTTFTDSSPIGHLITANGNAQVDTAYKKFGSGSLKCDGSNDYLVVPDHLNWFMDADPFTIDAHFRFAALPDEGEYMSLFGQYVDADNYAMCDIIPSSGIYYMRIKIYSGGVSKVNIVGATSIVINTWYHLGWIRGWGGVTNTWALSLDGTAKATATDTDAWPDLAADFVIGKSNGRDGEIAFNGWIDEFRVSQGIARWTNTFQPLQCAYR